MADPALIVFDSGFGGLSVVHAVRAAGMDGPLVYVADHAGFPYGPRDDADVRARVVATCEAAAARAAAAGLAPAGIVAACSTASTIALDDLRARFESPIVGVVPAVKPAAAASRSGMISVLATQGTARRAYLQDLIADFAGDAGVTVVGAPNLARIAEAVLAGDAADAPTIAADIAPAFVTDGARRTDVIALACTHYPLILDDLKAAAPWPVAWIDPAEAIARRIADVAPDFAAAPSAPGRLLSTRPPRITAALADRLARLDLTPDAVALAGSGAAA